MALVMKSLLTQVLTTPQMTIGRKRSRSWSLTDLSTASACDGQGLTPPMIRGINPRTYRMELWWIISTE